MSVSKKIDKSAVVRNKIRRRVYSILETELNLLKPNLLLFLQAKKGIETSSFVDLKDDVVGLLQKAKVVSF
ncbi:MAG: Ribonuclease [Candidatus Parcubacteria bacterium]